MNFLSSSAPDVQQYSLPTVNSRQQVYKGERLSFSRVDKTPCVVLIENPRSGFNSRHSGALRHLCEKEQITYRSARTPEEMECCVGALLAREPDVLVVSGGDGTVSAILGIMQRKKGLATKPVLALLRGGSTNMIHRELGLRGSPKQALRDLLDSVQTGVPEDRIRWRSPLGVRISGESMDHVGFFFALGAMPRVLRVCQNVAGKGIVRGIAVEVLGLAGAFFRLLFQDAAEAGILHPEIVHWNRGAATSRHYSRGGARLFVYLTSLNRLLFGFDPRGRRNALKLVGFKYPFRKWTLVSYLFSRGRSGQSHPRDLEHDSADCYSLSFCGQWVLDGEFHGLSGAATSLHVRTCEAVPFLVS